MSEKIFLHIYNLKSPVRDWKLSGTLKNREDGLMVYDERYKTDVEYMKTFYPPMAREILAYVSEVCDQAEYEGSPMFDEYFDRVRFLKMADQVYQKAGYMENMYRLVLEEDEGLDPGGHCVSCRGTDSWLKNLIAVTLISEIHYRRYRYFKRTGKKDSPAWH